MNDTNPYSSPANSVEKSVHDFSLRATTSAIEVLSIVVVLCAVSQLVASILEFVKALRYSAAYAELFEPISRYAKIRGVIELSTGIVLFIIVVRGRKSLKRLFDPGQSLANLKPLSHRFALYGFALSCVGIVANEAFGGAISYAFTLVIMKLLAALVFLGCGTSLLALTLAYDLRTLIGKPILSYVLATLGLVSSGLALIYLVIRFARDLISQLGTTI